MAWWRSNKSASVGQSAADDLATALYHEEEKQRLHLLREQNSAYAQQERERVRLEDRAWQRAHIWKPPISDPFFQRNDQDGLIKRAAKHVANRQIHSVQVDLRRWQDDIDTRREAKAQARIEAQARRDEVLLLKDKNKTQAPREAQQPNEPVMTRTQRQQQQAETQLARVFGTAPQEPPAPAPRGGMRR
jgi:hypothetical protein